MEIKPLSKNVVSKIRSYGCINNMAHCVTELVLNSLDAKSSAIAIRINPNSFKIQIVDNGIGISQENMENIARKNYTNKCFSLDDLDHKAKTHGYRGESLWSISHISKNLNITSKCCDSNKTFSKNILNGKQAKIVLVKNRQSNGTTVTVDGLFNSLPVRQKVTKKECELEEIVSILRSLSIINPQVSFSLRNDFTGKLLLKCQKHDNVMQTLISVYPDIKEDDLTVMKVSKDKLKIDTLFLKEITYCQIIQQIFVNRRPAVFPDLLKLLCKLLQKGVNKAILNENPHPMFIMNLKCPLSHYNLSYEDSRPVVEFKNFYLLEKCVEKMISSFLGKPLNRNENLKQENKIKSICGTSDLLGAIKGYGFKNWFRETELDNRENESQSFLNKEQKLNELQEPDPVKNTEEFTKVKKHKLKKPKPLPIEICEFKNKKSSTDNKVIEKIYNVTKSRNEVKAIDQNYLHGKYSMHPDIPGILTEHKNVKFSKNYENLKEKLENLINKKDMNSTLFTNFTSSENKGKDIIMYMFLKSTELFSNNEYSKQQFQQSVDETLNNSNETIMESNIFFENTRKTKTHHMNKTVSISVKLKRRRNKSPEERINIHSNATFTCTKPKRRTIEDSNEINVYTNLKKNDKATSPLTDQRKRNHQSTEYTTNHMADKNIQTTLLEERSKVEFCNFSEIPKKKIKYFDANGKNTYSLKNNERKTITTDHTNLIFNNNLHKSKPFHFESPYHFNEIKLYNHFEREEFQHPTCKSFIFNKDNENIYFSDWNRSRLFHFEGSNNNNRKIKSYKKESVFHNYGPFTCSLNELPDDLSADKLKNSFRQYAHEYLKSAHKMNDLTLGKSINFENLSVSPIPKVIPLPDPMKIPRQIAFEKSLNAENILQFKKYSTESHIPNICRNDDYATVKKNQVRKVHTEPTPFSRNLYIKKVKRNIDKLFLDSRSTTAANNQKDCPKKHLTMEIFTKDSLENIPKHCTPKESISLWKKFIERKINEKNTIEDTKIDAIEYPFKKPNRIEGTAPLNQLKILSKYQAKTPFSPDLFSDSRPNAEAQIQFSKVDFSFQPNSQPSREIGENLSSIEEDILLKNGNIAVKESCLPTLTVTSGNSPKDHVKKLIDTVTYVNIKNDSITRNTDKDEWIEKLDVQGNKFYFNTRTGMTSFGHPKLDKGFNFKQRFEFMPKGLSPVLMQADTVEITLSPNRRIKLHDEILKSYENELDTVKWEKYFKENDPRKFFHELYKEKRNDYETEVPDVFQPNISRSIAVITGEEYTFSRELFEDLEVIGQLDLKFITTIDKKHKNLIMFDQHAVHERIRLEKLEKEYDGASTPCENITLFVIQCDIKLLKHHEKYLNNIGLYFRTFKNGLTVYKIPLCLYNKVKKEPKQNSWNLAKLVELLLQEILNQIKMNRGIITGLPKSIHEIINLEACRGAIKFGDYLSETEMKEHIRNLSQCSLPFQCAHGRPTLVPILNLTLIPQVQISEIHKQKLK